MAAKPKFRRINVNAPRVGPNTPRKPGQRYPFTAWCKNCLMIRPVSNWRCWACYQYHKRTGRERPSWLWNRPNPRTRKEPKPKMRDELEMLRVKLAEAEKALKEKKGGATD